ncbi:hypothetical protein [Rhizobium leguminosarum]|uniref:hypothetical protein n=1 Tax=Rhizobium leguminosarum TaxID=384 RepID=UPI00103F0A95|nr:hypothetical protein [Rhizobium leguminosarum]TCA08612.1 hypothetical protein E0H63_07375 [Rhizobium leguminosarum bv. viciae]
MANVDKVQKASAAVALLIIGGIGVLVVYGATTGYIQARDKKTEIVDQLAQIDKIENSSASPASKGKQVIEIAYSTWDTAAAVDAKYPNHLTLNRVGEHVQQGYQQSEPLSAGVLSKAASATCMIRVRGVSESSPTFVKDNLDAFHAARSDLEAWRPYLLEATFNDVWADCQYRFQIMQSRYDEAHKPNETVTLRDIGEKFGRASSDIGKWWGETTKPVTDAVDEFEAGYNAGK